MSHVPEPAAPTLAFHTSVARPQVSFGPFEFDCRDHVLRRDGRDVALPPRAAALLGHLVERPGRIVTKQELLDAVWKEAYVSESSLTEAMGVLRQTLGDTAANPTYIQTVHRRGYRFVAPLRTATTFAAPVDVVSAAPPRRLGWPTMLISALVLVGAAAGVWFWPVADAPRIVRSTLTLPESVAPSPSLSASTVLTVSPDGRRVVYVGGSPGSYRLYLRALDRFEATPLPGTDGAHGAFFDPTGEKLGFFRGNRLFVVSINGGEPIDLAPAGGGHGGWWTAQGDIYVATGMSQGLLRVPSAGGAAWPVGLDSLDPSRLRYPAITPDGRTLVATYWQRNVRQSQVAVLDLARGTARLAGVGLHPRPISNDHMVFVRDQTMVVQPIDGSHEPIPAQDAVMTGVGGAGQYTLSAEGTLVYLPDLPTRRLRRLATFGASSPPLAFDARAYQNVVVSPDSSRVAVTIYERGAADLWVGDIGRGSLARLTTDGGVLEPVWSPDGRWIYAAISRDGVYRLLRVAADGAQPAALISTLSDVVPTGATTDQLFVQRLDGDGGGDLLIVDLADPSRVRDWLVTSAHEGLASWSPDGRWVVYESGRSGRTEIYLRPTNGRADSVVSIDGGSRPAWSADGRFIYYMRGRTAFRVEVSVTGGLGQVASVGTEGLVALVRPSTRGPIGMLLLEETRPLTTINVVTHWTSGLQLR